MVVPPANIQIPGIRCVNLFVKLLVAEVAVAVAGVAVVHQQVARQITLGTAVGHVGPILIHVIQEVLQTTPMIAACAGNAHKGLVSK